MMKHAAFGSALLVAMGSAAFGQTMLWAEGDKAAGEYAPGDTAIIRYYIQDLTPIVPEVPAVANWALDFIGTNPEDAALSYGTFTFVEPGPPIPPHFRTFEFWRFTPGPLFPETGGPFTVFVVDPLPARGGTVGPDNRGSSMREPPAHGPGWSVFLPPINSVFLADADGLLDRVLLATFEVSIDDDAVPTLLNPDGSIALLGNTVLGGGGPLAQLEWVTELDALFNPARFQTEDGFGQTTGGLIGQSLVTAPVPVPEPGALALLVAGLSGGLLTRKSHGV